MSAYVVTFYSFKGGVGRSTLLAQTAFRLAEKNTVRIWDLDLEAPGLHLMPDLKPEKIPAQGFLEWLAGWQKNPQVPLPEKSLKSLRKAIATVPGQPKLSILPAFGKDADFARIYAGIDWHRWLEAEPDTGIGLFRALIAALSEDCDYLLIDSRTGISNLGGWLAAVLPHATVLVAGYGEQNTLGAAHIFDALEDAREGRMPERIAGHDDASVKLRQLMVASPVPIHNPAKLDARRKVWESRFGSPPSVEIPFDPELLLLETAKIESLSPELDKAYGNAAQRLETLRAERELAIRRAGEMMPETRIAADGISSLRMGGESRVEKGATFEERMARLLELNGFKVERERIIDGNRVDLVARTLDIWNKETVYWVECKDHQKAAPKEELEKLCVWLNGKDARAMRAVGLFIANDYSPAARSFAESQSGQIILVTPRELENKLFDFRPYLAKIVGEYENAALFKTYVRQRILLESRPDDPVGDALEYGLDWVAGAGRRLWLVLGDYGTGKSALVQRLAYELAKRALAPQAGEPEPVIPLFINLKFQPNAVSLENLLFEHFARDADGKGFNPAVLLYLLEAGRIVLLLDSFDEMGLAAAGRSVEEQFRMLAYPAGKVPLTIGGNRVLISCRTHFFRDQQLVKACTEGPGDSLVSADSPLGRAARAFDAAIDELELFDDEQIGEFLRRHLGESAAAEMQRFIGKTYDLPNLAPYPILLDMMVKSLPELKRGGGAVTPATLYFAYTKTWLEDRSGGQLLSSPEQRRVALEHLAQSLWRRPERHIHHSDLAGELRALPAQLLAGLDFTRLDLELRTAAFLVRNAEGQYRFSHKSFLEYFYARRLLRAADDGTLAGLLDAPPSSPETAAFLADLARDGSAEDFQARLFGPLRDILAGSYQPRVSENALRLLFDAARHVAGNPPEMAAAILEKWLPRPLEMPGADLRGMNLGYASLREARLAGANLDGADLRGADLAGADLKGASLRHALLAGAKLSGADLSEAALLGVLANETDFSHADLSRASLDDGVFPLASFTNAKLPDAHGLRANFHQAILTGADCLGADFSHADLRAADVAFTGFRNARLQATRWAGVRRAAQADWRDAGLARATAPGQEADFPVPLRPVPPLPAWLLQSGHMGSVTAVAWSPDGSTLLTGSDDNTARLWDAASGRELRRFEGHDSAVMSVAWSPDGSTLLTGSDDKTARLWDAASGRELRRFEGHDGAVWSVAWSPDGSTLLTGSHDQTARLWDAASGRELRRLEGHSSAVSAVTWSPDGSTLLTGSHDNTACLWDAASGRELRRFEGHGGWVWSVAWSPDGSTLLTGSADQTARLWDAASGRELRRFEGHGGWVWSVAWSPDGSTLLTGSTDNTARLWDAASGRELRRLEGHGDAAWSVAWSPDGSTLLTGSHDNTARLWDAASGRELRRFEGHGNRVAAVAWSPDGSTLLTGSTDQTARMWDAASGRELRRLEGHGDAAWSLAWSPDGSTLLTGSHDNTARLWDAASGRELRRLEGHRGAITSVAWSPDGSTLLTGSHDDTARLWDAASGRELRRIKGHGNTVAAVAWSPDGSTLLTGSHDNTARLWDVASGRELRLLEGHSSAVSAVAWSPDGSTLLTGSYDQTAHLWDAASGRELRRFEGHGGAVTSVAWSPDGGTLLTGSDDQTARLWDAASGRELRRFEGHGGAVTAVAWSPDGSTLLTGSHDKTARLWDAASGRELRILFPVENGWLSLTPDGKAIGTGAGLEALTYYDPDEIAVAPTQWLAADLPAWCEDAGGSAA